MAELKITNYQERIDFVKKEHEVLGYWDDTKAFEESVSSRPENNRYIFYDGPPFATGTPHYGHILASTIKDVIPRYWTMKGYRVDRVWGWDCHGIPIENMIEKELGLKGGKKGIEELGIDKFNAACRLAILRFDKEWEQVIHRIGRWVDFKHSYKTMDLSFMESVWWAFKSLFEKGFVYEGRRVILYCPRCATPLSNFEIAMDNSYKDVEDNSVYVKFKIKGKQQEYLLAWTTTPWTLIGNVALAVDPDATYIKVLFEDAYYYVAEDLVDTLLKQDTYTIEQTVTGKELEGIEYESLYDYMPLDNKKAHYVTTASFVSLTDGTGIVHTAAVFGEDDYKLAVEKDLPRVPTLNDQGKFLEFVTPLADVFYKKAEQWIIDDLSQRKLLLKADKITHSYPFCYRCEAPLYYNAVPAWFIDIQKMKPDLIKQNENINWYPDHLKHGRFGKGIETAPDWNISRSRYWGTPMPVWRSANGEQTRIIGSLEELKTWAVDTKQVEKLTDIHREFLDDIEVWVDDKKTVKGLRIPEVFDCWVESGSMPYASIHYPFEQKDLFEKTHPAQFIAEYIAQTRAWFYTLHVMSVGLFGRNTFENAVTTGTILAEDGAKMSKSKKNYPDPALLFEKYGVDSLRFYLMNSVVMKGENLNFSEAGVKEAYQRVISLLWNTFSFYKLYATESERTLPKDIHHVLDRWVLSKTHRLIHEVTQTMDSYDMPLASKLIAGYIDELSTWYLRRSRERLKDDLEVMNVFGYALETIALVIAPITPFISELMWQNLGHTTSIHREQWPIYDESFLNDELELSMNQVRTLVTAGHAVRKNQNVPLKQQIRQLDIELDGNYTWLDTKKELLDTALEELNILQIKVNGVVYVSELSQMTDAELEWRNETRKLIRTIQRVRKDKGLGVKDSIFVVLPKEYDTLPKRYLDEIQTSTIASSLSWGDSLEVSIG